MFAYHGEDMGRFKLLTLFACAVIFCPSPADAGFRYVPSGSTPATTSNIVVEGFADQVPLTVALRQVLPRGMVYSIAEDVDLQTRVSWQGGQPWRDVLISALQAVGLRATFASNMVRVERGTYAAAPLPAVPMAAAPVQQRQSVQQQSITNAITKSPAAQHATDMPIRLQPPVVLTPPPEPVPAPAYAQPASRMVVQGEVTSMDAGLPPTVQPLGTTQPSRPLGNDFTVNDQFNGKPKTAQLVEITSLDPDIRAEAAAGITGPVTVGSKIDTVHTLGTLDNEQTTLAPLPGTDTVVPAGTGTMGFDQSGQWTAKVGQMLHDVLIEWAARANVEVNWQAEYDYPIQASVVVNGTFEDAVRTMLHGFRDAKPQPLGRLHKNDALGQQVLVVTVRGGSSEE